MIDIENLVLTFVTLFLIMLIVYLPKYIILNRINYESGRIISKTHWCKIFPLKPIKYKKKIFWFYPCYMSIRPLDLSNNSCYYNEKEFAWEVLKGHVTYE